MTARPVLEVSDLSVGLAAGAPIVEDVSFFVEAGRTACLVGESGSGKSMIANAVMGLLPGTRLAVTGGGIWFRGTNLLHLAPRSMRDLRGRRIGMIFQDPMSALNPVRTIASQFGEVFSAHGVEPAGGRRARMRELLDLSRLPDPARILAAYPFELSGGQRQRVMISMAMALNPDLLIADEPTTALDVTTQAQILQLIGDLQKSFGTAVLFITHDFGVVAEIADEVVVLRDGRVVEQGLIEEVLGHPREDYTRSLIAAVPEWRPRPDRPPARPIVSAQSLRKTFKGRLTALDDVSADVGVGETLGVVGESGSGKSTFAKCLVGLEEADSGTIAIHGAGIAGLSPAERRRRRHVMQMVFQDPTAALNPRHSIGQILVNVAIANGCNRAAAREKALALIEDVKLPSRFLDRYPHELSGGQRQRVCIARALAADPEILIADEALSALDVSVQRQVLDLFGELKAKRNLAILFITHDIRVAAGFCDRLVVMHQGRIVARGAPTDVLGESRHPYVETLMAAMPGRDWFPVGPVAGFHPAAVAGPD